MELSVEQQDIAIDIVHWYRSTISPYITIGGYAGTGKTFLIGGLRHMLKKEGNTRVAFVTYTGKASTVLLAKLNDHNAVHYEDFVGTIHSLIYKPKFRYDSITRQRIIIGWGRVHDIEYDLIIVDEASMVGKEIWDDLSSFNIPIVAIGDHGQLPPVGDTFSLMNKPDRTLTKIHRQAAGSAIIQLSANIRKYGYIPMNTVFSKDVFKICWHEKKCEELWNKIDFDENTIALTGFNKSRVSVNNMIRKKLNFTLRTPYPGERIICLRNNRYTGMMNGQISTLLWNVPFDPTFTRYTLEVSYVDEPVECLGHNLCYGKVSYDGMYDIKQKDYKKTLAQTGFDMMDFFDYGYCTSVHKSQGSEWDRVVLFEQRSSYWDDEYYKNGYIQV